MAKEKPVGFAAVSAEDHRSALGLPPAEEKAEIQTAAEADEEQPGSDGHLDGQPAPEPKTAPPRRSRWKLLRRRP